jgi:hypothetical protein
MAKTKKKTEEPKPIEHPKWWPERLRVGNDVIRRKRRGAEGFPGIVTAINEHGGNIANYSIDVLILFLGGSSGRSGCRAIDDPGNEEFPERISDAGVFEPGPRTLQLWFQEDQLKKMDAMLGDLAGRVAELEKSVGGKPQSENPMRSAADAKKKPE